MVPSGGDADAGAKWCRVEQRDNRTAITRRLLCDIMLQFASILLLLLNVAVCDVTSTGDVGSLPAADLPDQSVPAAKMSRPQSFLERPDLRHSPGNDGSETETETETVTETMIELSVSPPVSPRVSSRKVERLRLEELQLHASQLRRSMKHQYSRSTISGLERANSAQTTVLQPVSPVSPSVTPPVSSSVSSPVFPSVFPPVSRTVKSSVSPSVKSSVSSPVFPLVSSPVSSSVLPLDPSNRRKSAGPTFGAGRRHTVGGDPVWRLLRRLQRRRQLPPLHQHSNYSLVLVTDTELQSDSESESEADSEAARASRSEWESEPGSELESKSGLKLESKLESPVGGGPLPWPRHRPPVPVSAALVGVPQLTPVRSPPGSPLWAALGRVARWLRGGRRGGDQDRVNRRRSRGAGSTVVMYKQGQTGAAQANNSTNTDKRIKLMMPVDRVDTRNVMNASTLKIQSRIAGSKPSRLLTGLPYEELNKTINYDGSDEDSYDLLAKNKTSPLSTHNMDEAPVTRYNVQNLVPANGHLPSTPIDGSTSGGGHGALYRANTAGPEYLPSARRPFPSGSVLGPLHVWSGSTRSKLGLISPGRPSEAAQLPAGVSAALSANGEAILRRGNDSWYGATFVDRRVTLPDKLQREDRRRITAEKEHRMTPERTLTWPRVTHRGKPASPARSRPTTTARTRPTSTRPTSTKPTSTRPTSTRPPTSAIYVTPAAPVRSMTSLYVTQMPPLWAGSDTLSQSLNVTMQPAPLAVNHTTTRDQLLSNSVSHAIWTDLVGEGLAVPEPEPAPTRKQPLELLVGRLTELGSRYVLGRPAGSAGSARPDGTDAGLAPQLEALQDELGRLDGDQAVDVLVRVGANLLSSQLAGPTLLRRKGYGAPTAAAEDPLCRCPKSSVTPGVLAALTSLLALLIYAASLATLAVTSGTTGSGGTSATATAAARSLKPTPLPGERAYLSNGETTGACFVTIRRAFSIFMKGEFIPLQINDPASRLGAHAFYVIAISMMHF